MSASSGELDREADLNNKRVTQKDIAEALDLSLITVQRALNNSGYVSAQLRQRIAEYVRDVHYVPHKASQVLKRNKTRRLALFSSSEPGYFWEDVGAGIDMAAEQIRAFDYRVDYYKLRDNDCEEFLRLLGKTVSEGVDGVGFANKWLKAMPAAARLLGDAGVPFVTFNVDAPGSGRLCHIGTDEKAGGRLAADYLGKVLYFRERPRILALGTDFDAAAAEETVDLGRLRLDGFFEVIKDRLPGAEVVVKSLPWALLPSEAGPRIEAALGEEEPPPDGIYLVAACNPAFIHALEILRLERSYSVLHDLDNSSLHYLGTHPLMAVISQNPILQGYDAVRILERILETGKCPEDRIEIVHSLVFEENREHYTNVGLAAQVMSFPD
jgi:LacI family transcriptional regulator